MFLLVFGVFWESLAIIGCLFMAPLSWLTVDSWCPQLELIPISEGGVSLELNSFLELLVISGDWLGAVFVSSKSGDSVDICWLQAVLRLEWVLASCYCCELLLLFPWGWALNGSALPLGRLQLPQTVTLRVLWARMGVRACSVLGPLGFWVKPFWGFSFSAAVDLECAPHFLGSSAFSISLVQGGGVCAWGSAFSLIEANSPLYSIKMPHSHLPSLLRSVLEVLSSKCSQIGE